MVSSLTGAPCTSALNRHGHLHLGGGYHMVSPLRYMGTPE
eukprot:CAMPEP_0195055828 /NCGR_PEP_ID=MMETSP0448-20130528/4420_1 /TAXON_ID=66468 /ORGANISM="Heterocapsa triquestra, Strain CCMP 448" /LENGTH=39 /DNA_ID= /DNA_START= /DNA_END= /DNA_ORIENTATION=